MRNIESAKTTRRRWLQYATTAGASLLLPGLTNAKSTCPAFLSQYQGLYESDPRKAAIKWFTDARFGLFMHYGLYSLLGKGEWVQYHERIPVDEYAKLKDRFSATKFDADFITDLAIDAGMRYVNLTSRHHDSFCLFKTQATDFNSLNSPAKRDLVGELAAACERKKLGLFLYYSYAADWRHPYFYPREKGWRAARPAYEDRPEQYRFETDADFRHYIRFAHQQLKELLTQYPSVAGIWLDPIMGYYARPDLFPIETTYSLIRTTKKGCLISFKQGANGDEDFAAPERKSAALDRGGEVAARAWAKNKDKPIEICNTLQPRAWGYDKSADGEHRNADEVMKMLDDARHRNANLLLNTGPLPEGDIHPADIRTLREVGRRLRRRSATQPSAGSK